MPVVTPNSPEQIAEFLLESQRANQTIEVVGNGSKRRWGGPITPCANTLNTTGIDRLINYERNDLTVSVEAGMPFAELQNMLGRQGQMIALDPPYATNATVGGLLAANCSGPMRRQYGTMRDLVIGMTFATLEGKLVSSGGQVVKNVAGLDMGKVLIGSFGTLAVIVSANFRVHPIPEKWKTFIYSSPDLDLILARRSEVAKLPLRPIAVDLLNPAAARQVGLEGFILAIRAVGSSRSMARYSRELADCQQIEGPKEMRFWEQIREFAPNFLENHIEASVLRFTIGSQEIGDFQRAISIPAICRSGSNVVFVFSDSPENNAMLWIAARKWGWRGVMEATSQTEIEDTIHRWSANESQHAEASSATMKNVKSLFDPNGLLNPLRLYGRI